MISNIKYRYHLLYALVWTLSLIPLHILYILSDFIAWIAHKVIHYRIDIVRKNLKNSFPERSEEELRQIEKEFYAFFADYIVETIKMCSISPRKIRKHMHFEGVEEMVKLMKQENKQFGFLYLAHYGNWEWISSLSMHIHDVDKNITTGQIYHPLKNTNFDKLFLKMRGRFGGDNIAMKETLRYIFNKRNEEKVTIIGFISDQTPKWESIHHWIDFLHHYTPVFTGAEQIGKKVSAAYFYAHMKRIKRGYYVCKITPMPLKNDAELKSPSPYPVTDVYFKMLEETIKKYPSLWLWTHNRWKRTIEEYTERMKSVAQHKH